MKKWHWITLAILFLISLTLEFTYLSDYKSHWWNSVPAFYSLWGGLSAMVVIYGSSIIGKLFLLRKEKYYDH
jgi:hypothetical protein